MKKRVILKIDGDIASPDPTLTLFGMDDANVVSAKNVDTFLNENADADEVLVEITSYGGSVDEGIVIYEMLRASGKKIIVHGYRVASAATIVFLAAEKRDRYIAKNSLFIVHFPYVSDMHGSFTSDDLDALADSVRVYNERVLDIYKERLLLTDADVDAMRSLMKEDKDIGADGAIDWGFANKYIDIKPLAFSNKHIEIFAKYSNTKTNNKMKNKKGWLAGLLAKAGLTVKAASIASNDGVVIYFDGEELAVDMPVFIDEEMTIPAEDKDYELENGKIATVQDGIVVALVDADTESDFQDAVEKIVLSQAVKIKALEKEISAIKAAAGGASIPAAQSQRTGASHASDSKFAGMKSMAKSKFN